MTENKINPEEDIRTEEEILEEQAEDLDEEQTRDSAEGDVSEEAEAADEACDAEEAEKAEEAEETEETEDADAKYMRLMADFQNFKRRTEKERNDIYAYANEKIVTDLLEVIDNFERALEHDSADAQFVEGMEMIFNQFKDVLEKAGLEEIKAMGEDFDPNFHNAVMTGDDDNFESGKVIEVFQKGYLLNNKVIRPSMVKVNN